jgi:hypothetical protein
VKKSKKPLKSGEDQYNSLKRLALFHLRRVTWLTQQVRKAVREDDLRGAQLDGHLAIRDMTSALDKLVFSGSWRPKS